MKMITILILITLYFSGFLPAQTPGELASQSDLFTNEQPLEVTIEMDIKSVISDTKTNKYHQATFSYIDREGGLKGLDIKIRTRGNMRSSICAFPPLMINFKKKEVLNTIFAGQDKLKMVTHCKRSFKYEQYVLLEYLIYKHYNVLTDKSFRVRLMKVNYKDTERKKSFTQYALLIEDEDLMAARNGMVSFNRKLKHQDFCDRSGLDLMMVFQYMIGNTDFHIPNMHNVKFIAEDPRKPPIPVPFDFDYSGVVFAEYAAPHESIPVKEVRDRFFIGFCRKEGEYEKIFELFNSSAEIIYDVYRNSGLLDKRILDSTLKYFDKFYEIINDPKLIRKKIMGHAE